MLLSFLQTYILVYLKTFNDKSPLLKVISIISWYFCTMCLQEELLLKVLAISSPLVKII